MALRAGAPVGGLGQPALLCVELPAGGGRGWPGNDLLVPNEPECIAGGGPRPELEQCLARCSLGNSRLHAWRRLCPPRKASARVERPSVARVSCLGVTGPRQHGVCAAEAAPGSVSGLRAPACSACLEGWPNVLSSQRYQLTPSQRMAAARVVENLAVVGGSSGVPLVGP
jgi:hypothetical protein